MTKVERIRALMGNIKNWSWDVFPQFRLEKEDADALLKFFRENYPDMEIARRNDEDSFTEKEFDFNNALPNPYVERSKD